MTSYEAVSEHESLIPLVDSPAQIKRKPLPVLFQRSPLSTPPFYAPDQDDGKHSHTTSSTVETDRKSNDNGSSKLSHGRRARGASIWRLWKWELLSLAASAALLIAIIITLREFDNKDLSDWKAPVSINAVISVLSALFKGSLGMPAAEGISQLKWLWFSSQSRRLADLDKFDMASRSIWGAVRFIARQFGRERLSLLGSFGAFLALVSLTVDPFSQASVSIVTCERVVSTPAKVLRANVYSANGGHVGAGLNELDAPMQIAISSGTTQPPPNSSRSMAADVVCPSANCTFPATEDGASFMTLAMCHSCLDITTSVTRVGENEHALIYGSSVNISMVQNTPGQVAFTMAASQLPDGPNGNAFPDGPWLRTSLMDFQGIVAQNTDSSCTRGKYCNSTPFAFDCSLRPCIKTFAAKVSNGIYSEEEISRQFLHYLSRNQSSETHGEWIWTFQRAVDRRIVNGTWVDCDSAVDSSDRYPIGVPQGEDGDGSSILWYRPECVYLIRAGAVWAISQYFRNLIVSGKLGEYTTSVYQGDAWKEMLWNLGQINLTSVNSFTEGVANAIGAQMRRAAEPADDRLGLPDLSPETWTFAHGQGLQSRPCIRVRWKWISLLGVLFLAEVTFLTVLIVMNRRSGWSGDWKSSSLPLLLQHIDMGSAPTSQQDQLSENKADLYKAADMTQTRLSQVDGKWRLVLADSIPVHRH